MRRPFEGLWSFFGGVWRPLKVPDYDDDDDDGDDDDEDDGDDVDDGDDDNDDDDDVDGDDDDRAVTDGFTKTRIREIAFLASKTYDAISLTLNYFGMVQLVKFFQGFRPNVPKLAHCWPLRSW